MQHKEVDLDMRVVRGVYDYVANKDFIILDNGFVMLIESVISIAVVINFYRVDTQALDMHTIINMLYHLKKEI